MDGDKVRHIDFHADEWLSGTFELGPFDRGVYITICALLWSRNERISPELIKRHCGGSAKAINASISRLVSAGKIECIDGLFAQNRAEKELLKAQYRIDSARINGGFGGRPSNKNNEVTKPGGYFSEKLTTNHQPPTTNLKREDDQENDLGRFAPSDLAQPSEQEIAEVHALVVKANEALGNRIRDPVAYAAAVKSNRFIGTVRAVNDWASGHLDGAELMRAWEVVAAAQDAGERLAMNKSDRRHFDQLDRARRASERHAA